MKLTALDLKQHLLRDLKKMYVLSGDDRFLVQEAFSALQTKAFSLEYVDRIRLNVEVDADLEAAYQAAYTPPLLRQKRFLELHFTGKLTKSCHQFLQNYALQPSPHTLLVVSLGKLHAKTEQTAWFKALEKSCVIVTLWPLPARLLPGWIVQRAKAMQLQMTTDAADLLAHYVEGNLQAAAQEIEKLSLCGSSHLNREHIEYFVSDQGSFTAFDLFDQILQGNGQQILRILQHLKSEGSEPLMILGALTYELRNLAKLTKAHQKGLAPAALFTQFRVKTTRQTALKEFLKKHKEEHILSLLLKAADLDRIAKGATPGNAWLALEDLSLSAAGLTPFPQLKI